jgi:asparagine synthase (glutamine-hydrolysing)
MCGIVGCVGARDIAAARLRVEAAAGRLAHRGPDADGLYVDDRVVLGHRRLSVIDPTARSNQPMAGADGAMLIFNGEIYNFRELAASIESAGHRLRTSSDTEVVLAMLAGGDPAQLDRLDGMFALACWLPKRNELLLARDRFGEKPLFYVESAGGLAFASELPALITASEIQRRVDRVALSCYLETGFVPAPLTMFANVRALEPGAWLRWRDGVISTGRLAELHAEPDPSLSHPGAAAEAVRAALRAAVRRQMVSDVPLGAFLSGGIDSSSVVALMQESSSRPISTFTVRFGDAKYDEGPVARRVAEHLGTDHHELMVSDASFREADLWRIIDHVGMPFHDSSAIPTYIVSRFARERVTVALSGDGGDEMFAGYPVFEWGRRVNQLSRIPRPLLATGASMLRYATHATPASFSGPVRQARKAFDAARFRDESRRFRAIHALFSPVERATLFADSSADRAASDLLAALPSESNTWTPLRRMMFSRSRFELASDMLVKVDRMSMAASLEVRAPFLDPLVADVSARLPDHLLIRDGVGKHILREAMRPLLPPEVFSHGKWGFSIPLHSFTNDEFRRVASDMLSPAGPLSGLLSPHAVRRIGERGLHATADRADLSVYQATHQLWALVQLGAWIHRFNVSL